MKTSYKKYINAWNKRLEAKKSGIEKNRKKAYKTAKKLSTMLVEDFGAKRVVLFGSTLKPDAYKNYSDIDLSVEGIKNNLFFRAYGMCMMKSSYPVDLIDKENASDLMKENISKGEVLYES